MGESILWPQRIPQTLEKQAEVSAIPYSSFNKPLPLHTFDITNFPSKRILLAAVTHHFLQNRPCGRSPEIKPITVIYNRQLGARTSTDALWLHQPVYVALCIPRPGPVASLELYVVIGKLYLMLHSHIIWSRKPKPMRKGQAARPPHPSRNSKGQGHRVPVAFSSETVCMDYENPIFTEHLEL